MRTHFDGTADKRIMHKQHGVGPGIYMPADHESEPGMIGFSHMTFFGRNRSGSGRFLAKTARARSVLNVARNKTDRARAVWARARDFLDLRVRVDRSKSSLASSVQCLFGTDRQGRGTILLRPNQCSGTYFLNHVGKMEPCDWSNARRESGMIFAAFRSTGTLRASRTPRSARLRKTVVGIHRITYRCRRFEPETVQMSCMNKAGQNRARSGLQMHGECMGLLETSCARIAFPQGIRTIDGQFRLGTCHVTFVSILKSDRIDH
jgi:hypothetical protein